MVYLGAPFAILFIAVYCFRFDGVFARVMFRFFSAFGFSGKREDFIRVYRLFIRSIGVVMIGGIVAGLAQR
jgi:hypothetical protein